MKKNANIIFNARFRYTQYCTKNLSMKEKKYQTNTKDMFEYYDRDEACDKTINTKDAFDYYDYRVGSKGGFSAKVSRDAKECQALIDKDRPEVVYQCVVSFDKEFAIENNIIQKKEVEKLIRKSMPFMLKNLGFENDNVEWTGFYHTNTDHPHVHFVFYEKIPTRKRALIEGEKLKKARSTIVSKLGLNINLYIQKDERLNELINSIRECCNDGSMISAIANTGNNSLKMPDELKPIIEKMVELENVLPHKGSMKYNSSNIRPYHGQIQDIIHELMNLDSVGPFMDKYKDLLKEIQEKQEELYGTGEVDYIDGDGNVTRGVGDGANQQNNYYEDRMKELETRMGNMILKTIKDARNDMRNNYGYVLKDEEDAVNGQSDTETSSTREDMDDEMETFVPSNKDRKEKKVILLKIKKYPKRKMKKNLKVRTNNLRHALVNELSRNIRKAYIESIHQDQLVQDVIRRAQQDIYATQIK